ncbi:hypothetical protein A3H16_04170 [Candidatus Kaiserbacteria bacterium RIFCSPLOWO2_12_FULL_53_8]|uniref:PhnB-like domain-containing protein n=2 Tax=Candidatus Kaiseribacteriota TaxID=1752734 RepID=A0A1F6CUS8_9BACT|nr:MAG: hypothetical protein A2851_00250 [Candidatus Kaiserbacteria bacterium RIFCSPHIGHO2_01_FULL_53_29]OGG92170.1 MAG: hypothetical protein A3H16_04170 [Candidatus Kaiserbacteria bacterium RIFCSPLOWO2_12_FULL_53_8]
MAQKITPHLWFDKEAKEAAAFYTSLFDNSKVTNTTTITGTPSGDCDIVSFELHGQSFMAISAGPYFKFTPAISFIVNFDPVRETSSSNGAGPSARAQIDKVWEKLAEGGKVLMEIGEYPFSKRYGWIQDKYGLSWQLILTNPEGDERPEIVPAMMFVGKKFGKAEEAVNFYLSVFSAQGGSQPKADGPRAHALGGKESKMGAMMKYPAGSEAGQEGTVMFADFKLLDTWLAVMDSAGEHRFDFNEAVSFIVNCDDQAEIDYYWEKLSAVPESEQCGWLKDKYGVSWQIVPTAMNEMVKTKDKKALARVTEAFLKMKKFDISGLQKAYEGA